MLKPGTVVLALLMLAVQAIGDTPEDAAYRREIEAWRKQREEKLKADGGWLTVTGLFWLKPGPNRFGSGPFGNDIALPAGSTAAVAGTFELKGNRVRVRLEQGVAATIAGKAVSEAELKSDDLGDPDVLTLGRLRLYVIKRGARYGIRMKDLDSDLRRRFKGLAWYPIAPDWHITARFEPATAPRTIPVPTILNEIESMATPGTAVFTIHGREVRIDPVLESADANELFFIFRDETSGKGTYGAGRFLYAELPKDGKLILDFNKAYSPPCAFTPFATCPLPPKQNRLDIAIEAGEKFSGTH